MSTAKTAATAEQDARLAYLDAIARVKQAREAFGEAARAGFNAMREYIAWEQAVAEARKAAAVPAALFEQRYQARLTEFRWLSAEARRLEGLSAYVGGITGRGTNPGEHEYPRERYEADCSAWRRRASAYAGADITVVSPNAIRIDPIPKGTERPGTPAVPGPPDYVTALRTAFAGE